MATPIPGRNPIPLHPGWIFKITKLMVLGLTAFLLACTPAGPTYQPPRPEMPSAWDGATAEIPGQKDIEELGHWWSLFNDPLLDSLIKRGIAANPEVRIAETRILQARAQYRLTTATTEPTAGVSGIYANSRKSENTGTSNAGSIDDLFQVGFDSGWELDFFSGARRVAEAAGARLAVAGESRWEVLVSLEAEIARNYLELRGSQQRLATARENLSVQKNTLELARGRLASGIGNHLEVAQAETQLSMNMAQLPALENIVNEAILRLSLLLGLPPRALAAELSTPALLPSVQSSLPAALPSDLLRRRPDIRLAERQLAAATADIGVACADLFPRISLTGLAGLQSAAIGDLLSAGSRYWTIGPTIRWSLFDGGRVQANIDLNKARREEAQVVYEKTVLTALGEVESALHTLAREEETLLTLTDAVASGQRAVTIATGRYRAGLAGFLDVLESERAVYQSRDQLVISEQRRALAMVSLFKALGGGWNPGLDFPAATDEPTPDASEPPQSNSSGDTIQ